jgi:hypothetical protein
MQAGPDSADCKVQILPAYAAQNGQCTKQGYSSMQPSGSSSQLKRPPGGRGSHVHSDLRVQERLGRLGDLAAHAYRESEHSGHEGQVVPHVDAFSCTAGAEAPHQHVYRVQDAVPTFNAERPPLLYLDRCLPGIRSRTDQAKLVQAEAMPLMHAPQLSSLRLVP